MPSVIMELTGEPVATAADWGGYLMAVYALLQFFMAPMFGNLSDRFGRRPLLLASLAAFGVDFLLTGLATSMTWLFVGRAVAGVFGASYAAAGAYIGDISNDDNRAQNFGFIGAAWGCGFTLGPVIGGFVAEHIDPARAVLRGRRPGAGQRGVRLLRVARVTAARDGAASSNGRAPIPSAHSRAWPICPWWRDCCWRCSCTRWRTTRCPRCGCSTRSRSSAGVPAEIGCR